MAVSRASAAMLSRCTMRPSSITTAMSPSASAKRKFCSTSRMVVSSRLQLLEGADHVVDDGRRDALGRLVDQDQPARLDDGAGDRQHLLLPARQHAGGMRPEPLERREEARRSSRARAASGGPPCAASTMFSAHREVGEHAHGLRHVGDAGARDVGRGRAADLAAVERDPAALGFHSPMMVRSVVVLPAPLRPSSTVMAPARHGEVDALQDVILADVGVHAFQREQRVRHGRRLLAATPR